MKNRRNYYRVLHVDRDAPPAVIQASYRAIMTRLGTHPDLGGDPVEAALVNEAFAALSDPVRRAAYDETLADGSAQRGKTPEPPTAPPPRAASAWIGSPCSFCGAPQGEQIRPESVCADCGGALFPASRHDTGEASRRAMERLPRELPVTFRRAKAARVVHNGSTKDLSLNGMRLLSPVGLGVDERLQIENSFCTAVAVVRSATRRSSLGGWECGVEFLTLRLAQSRGGLISTVA